MFREMNKIRKSTKLVMKNAQDRAKDYTDNKFFLVNLKWMITWFKCSTKSIWTKAW